MLNKISLLYFFCCIGILIVLSINLNEDMGFQFFYLFFLFLTIFFVNKFFYEFKSIIYFSSILNLILISFFYFYNLKVNDYGFFPNFDDSYYFNQGRMLFNSNYQFDTLYDLPLGIMIKFGASTALALSSLNWFLSASLLGLIGVFSKKINPNFKSFYLFFIALNMLYLEATVIVLRDILGFVFFFLALIYIVEKDIKFNIFAVLTFLIRPTTGVLVYIFYLFYCNKYFSKNYKGKSFVILSLCILLFLIFNYIPLGFLTRSGFDGVGSDFTLSNMNENRMQMVTDSESDLTSKLLNMGLIGAPFVMLLNVLTPLRFRDLYSDMEYVFLNKGTYFTIFLNDVFDYKSVLNFIHIFILGFWIFPFLIGLKNILYIKNENKSILYIFIIGLFFVSFVSFQPRHKLHFLIFLPLICSYSNVSIKNIFLIGLFFDFIFTLILFKDLI